MVLGLVQVTGRIGKTDTKTLRRHRWIALTCTAFVASAIAVGTVPSTAGAATGPPAGTLDPAFGSGGMAQSSLGAGATGVAVEPAGVTNAGDVVVSGSPPTAPPQFQVGMFTPGGAVNAAFGLGGMISSFAGYALAVTAEPANGEVVAAGYASSSSQSCGGAGPVPVVVGYTPSGAPAFTADLRALTSRHVTASITSLSTTVTLTSGTFTSADVGAAICGLGVPSGTTIASVTNSTTALLSLPATLTGSPSVTISQVDNGQFNAVTVDANGNIVAAGQTQTAAGTPEGLVDRLTASGTLDTTFNTTGYLKTFAVAGADEAEFNSVAVVPPGPSDAGIIMVGGSSQIGANASQLTLAAFKPGGTPYAAFNASGALQSASATVTTGITIVTTGSAAGNVVAVGPGSSGSPILLQFKPNGTPFTPFTSVGAPQSGEVVVQPAAGTSDQLNAVAYDPFSGFLSVAGTATETSTQPPPPQSQTWVVGQYNTTTGAANLGFGTPKNGLVQGVFGTDPASAAAVAIQSDGKTVAAGQSPSVNADEGIGLLRLLGPTVTVNNAPTTLVTSQQLVPIAFQVSLTEPLALATCPILQVSGGTATNSTGSCPAGVVPIEMIPAGSTGISVQVNVPMTGVPPGFPITAQVTAKPGGGLAPNPTASVGSGIVERVFQGLPGAGNDIAVGANGAAWLIGTNPLGGGNFGIYHWTGTTWAQIPGGAVTITVDPSGNPWVINSSHSIYHWNGSTWQQFPGGGTDISVGANGAIWLIGTNPLGGGNFGIYHWTGTTWAQFPGAAVKIAVDPNGNPWVINSSHSIYHWNGSSWQLFPGGGTDISVGANGAIWLIGTNPLGGGNFGIYHWTGTTWASVPGVATRIAVDPNGNPWVINAAGGIYLS